MEEKQTAKTIVTGNNNTITIIENQYNGTAEKKTAVVSKPTTKTKNKK